MRIRAFLKNVPGNFQDLELYFAHIERPVNSKAGFCWPRWVWKLLKLNVHALKNKTLLNLVQYLSVQSVISVQKALVMWLHGVVNLNFNPLDKSWIFNNYLRSNIESLNE